MKRQSGFGLIEVFISFLLVAGTAGVLLQLHKVYLEYSRDGGYREVALRLAESKIDEIRSTDSLSAFNSLPNGGNEQKVIDNMTFELDWTISPVGSLMEKEVDVEVSWAVDAALQTFSLSSRVVPQLQIIEGPVGNIGNGGGGTAGGAGPQVQYTPGSIPDIVAVVTDPDTGVKQETTKPAPDVQNNDEDVVVSFDSIIYDGSNNRLIQSDTRTVYCSCDYQNGLQSTRRPARPYSLPNGIYWFEGLTEEKEWGDSDNPDCTVCCNDHFDVGSSSLFEDNFNQFNKGHGHTTDGSSPASAGQEYLESCRMLRIDGFFRVIPDWNLVALNVFPPSYLTDADNVQLYQEYIKEIVQEYVDEQKAGPPEVDYQPVSYRDWLVNNGDETDLDAFDSLTELFIAFYQLAARAIYVDLMPQSLLDAIDFNDANWLTKVPFNEVNVTLLANWEVKDSDKTYLEVTNEPVETTVDRGKNLFGTYSRGYVSTLQESSAVNPQPKVYASMTRYNSGLTGQEPLSPFDAGSVFETSLTLSVSSGSPTTTFISGKLECLTRQGQGSTPVACKSQDFNNTIATPTNGSCTIRKDSDPATAFYECTVSANQAITITFTHNQANSDFVFNPSSVNFSSDQVNTNTNIPCVMQINKNITNFGTYSCQP
ncbi:type IV pilus modification PilV family protein [Zobellella taiwanensis]